MSLALSMQSACKVMVASGIAKSDTHQILATLEREQNGSGSEFLLKRLKDLKRFCESKITGEPFKLSWFRTTRSGYPKDPGWRKLISSDPVKGIQNVSVLIMDMIHEPDQKTKDTIYDNVFRHDPISQDIRQRFGLPNKEFVEAFRKANKLSNSYPFHYRKYAPDTLQGISFPLYRGETYRVRTDRNGNKDKDDILTLYYEGLCSAPISLADHLLNKADVYRDTPMLRTQELAIEYWDTIQDIIRVEAFDNMSDLEDYGGDLSKVEIPQVVGAIGVIPSPGMKDRVIANPNPAVQSSLYQLGEYLGDVTKNIDGCYVYDQQAGIRKIQEYLEQGIELASIDMTAATDRLSADAGWDLISACARDAMPDIAYKAFECDLDYFKEVSRSAFYIGNLGDDDIEYISYTQGQPMGLKPSFPMLTLMNLKAGKDAQDSVPGAVTPVVVGDDIVIDARCLPHYLETIHGLGGVINMDKTLVSKTHSKFCSKLISHNSVIREKPRYVHGDRMQNALQLGNLRLLKPWEKSVALAAAANSIDDIDNININIDKTKLITRITDRAIQRLEDSGLDISLYDVQPEIAKLSLSLREDQETETHKEIRRIREDRFFYETGENLSDVYNSLEFIDHLDEMTIPVKVTKYDHHKGEHTVPSGDIQRVRKIAKSSKSNKVHQALLDHHIGDLLYDDTAAIFQPKGSDIVVDVTKSLNEKRREVANEAASRPISNKRQPLPPDYTSSLEEQEDDDEFSL